MSDRSTVPVKQALSTFRKTTDDAVTVLQQRPQGGPNGLIVPGGGGGTWKALTVFQNGWTALALDGQHDPQYALDADGFVHLRGLVARATAWPVGAILTLPIASAKDEFFGQAAFNNSVAGSVILETTGTTLSVPVAATIAWASAAGWFSLAGISYYAGGQ